MKTIGKAFTGLGGFILMAIGIGMLIVTIWAFTHASLAFNNYKFLGALLAVDLIIILVSVMGIIGVKKQNGCLIFIFQILVMVFFMVFLAIGIMALVLPNKLFSGDCKGSDNDVIADARSAYIRATSLCLTCKCALTNQDIEKNYQGVDQAVMKALPGINGTKTKYPDCINEDNQTLQAFYGILESVEYGLECTGWCQSENIYPFNLYYKFSDVARGKPTGACYDSMKDKLHSYGTIVGLCAFGAAAFLLLVSICGICVCMSKKGEPLRSRFIVNDGGYYRAAY